METVSSQHEELEKDSDIKEVMQDGNAASEQETEDMVNVFFFHDFFNMHV